MENYNINDELKNILRNKVFSKICVIWMKTEIRINWVTDDVMLVRAEKGNIVFQQAYVDPLIKMIDTNYPDLIAIDFTRKLKRYILNQWQ